MDISGHMELRFIMKIKAEIINKFYRSYSKGVTQFPTVLELNEVLGELAKKKGQSTGPLISISPH